ncbi:MAG: polymer-forming cytoskeletal protein [Pyrinomonadaceae bacterium]
MSNPNYNPTPQPTPNNHQSIEDQYRQSVETSSTTGRAVTEAESLARSIKDGALSGYVGNGTTLTGETTFKSMLRIDGQLTGKINSEAGTLIVGNQGRLDANVEVAIATIHGTVNGDIVATQRLELGRTAKVTGNIQTPSLMIEQGAVFEGSCQMVKSRAESEKRERDANMPRTEPITAKPMVETPAIKKPETAAATAGDNGSKVAAV